MMGFDMVKADLVHRAVEATTLQSPAAQEAVEALFESANSALARGDRVVLRRFGAFYTSSRRKGPARNPRTGEPADIPRGRVVRFRPAPGLGSVAHGS